MTVLNQKLKLLLPLAFVITLAGCSNEGEAIVQSPDLRPVKVMEVSAVSKSRALRYSGSVTARSEAATGFRVAGKIIERNVEIGDKVRAGDVMARLDATDFRLQVQSARASLEAADRQVETSEFALKRSEQLFRQQVTTKAQLEQAQLVFNQAVASRDSANAALQQALNQVEYSQLKADRDGIVTAINADAGQVIAAGSPVVTVAADGERDVLIAVPETDILAFRAGKLVDISFWSDRSLMLPGTVREVAGSADPVSRTFTVRVGLPPHSSVLLGMTATVEATAPVSAPYHDVPLAALSRDGELGMIVWTVDRIDTTVQPRPVTVEEFSDTGVKVTQGLSTGDLVVVAGTQFLSENMRVRLVNDELSHTALLLAQRRTLAIR